MFSKRFIPLLNEIISVARANDFCSIALEESIGNLRAYIYYLRQGFVVTGETSDKYSMNLLLK